MKRSDSFRKFFPGHVSVDKIIQNDESNKRRSQVSSNSQSQSQSTHYHSSLNTLTSDSQVSSSTRYEDMLASGRHLELKDSIETIRKNVNSLANHISTQQSTFSSHTSQLNNISNEIFAIKTTQDAQERTLGTICELLFELKENVQEIKNLRNIIPTSERSECEDDIDLNSHSQSAMSLDDYLVNKAKRARTSSPQHSAVSASSLHGTNASRTTSRTSSFGGSAEDDVSMTSGNAVCLTLMSVLSFLCYYTVVTEHFVPFTGSSLKRPRNAIDDPFRREHGPPVNINAREHPAEPVRTYQPGYVQTHAHTSVQRGPPTSLLPVRGSSVNVVLNKTPAAAACDDSAGLLFDDF